MFGRGASGDCRARSPCGPLGLAAGRARAKWVLLDAFDQGDDLVARYPVGELRMVAAEMLEREATTSRSVLSRTVWPHSHVICLAMDW
jgi:hypothetical protein